MRRFKCKGFVFGAVASVGLAAYAATQLIVLDAGWNLVSVQVGTTPWTIADIEAAIDADNVLNAVWGYDAATGTWKTCQPMRAGFPNDLSEIRQGSGYWVKVNDACVLTLDGEPWEGTVELRPGWNLVGFPGLGASNLASFFGNALANVQQVWGFSGGASQSFTGYDLSSMPQRKDLASVEPGKGYWVYALDTVTLTAMPSILLTGDVDMPPLQAQVMYTGANAAYLGRKVKLAGVEDSAADLNGNGILDDSETQDTLSFPIGVVRQPVIIGNDGAGAMNWSVSENCDWLSVEGDSSGTVAGSRAYVYLLVSRAGLAPGSYSDESVIITAGGVSKSVRVNMQVATVDGDFSGYASATKVNGKEIALGKVDMGLNVFVTTNTESGVRFKAVIDNDRSLLFPRDVFMNGVFYLGNSFSLTTSFSMPAGDRNAPPYDTFEHVDPANDQEGFGDRDWNTNGVLDVQNPFPFPVRRSVTLLGQRTDENTLAGSYLETIAGALPGNEKITVEGTFSLSRKSYSPTRRSIYNEQDSEYEVIGRSNATFERVITIAEAVQVNGVTTTLNIDFPKPEALTVTLTSPLGTVATLHNKGASVTALQELSDFDGENGKGDWILSIVWDPMISGGERGRYWSWLLNIGGIATYDATGRLVDENGTPIAGAVVSLSGSNEIGSQTTDANGNFTLTGLTENDYSLSVSIPGYQNTSTGFMIESGDVALGNIAVPSKAASGLEGIEATPTLGFAPLDVQFTVGTGGATASDVAAVEWLETTKDAAGNATTASISPAAGTKPWAISQHFDESVCEYSVTANVTKANGTTATYTYGPVGLLHSAMTASGTAFRLSNIGFIGGGAGTNMNAAAKTTVGMTWTPDIRFEQQKRDPAAFDVNRTPTNSFNVVEEDTDFFVQPDTPYYRLKHADSKQPCDFFYSEYEQPSGGADRFRLITTMGGCVFGDSPAQASGLMLQTGRIEE